MRNLILSACLSLTILPALAGQQQLTSYPNRRAVFLNSGSNLLITSYSFSEKNAPGSTQLILTENYKWKNIGKEDIVAVEMMTMSYGVFDDYLGMKSQIFAGNPHPPFDALPPGQTFEKELTSGRPVDSLSFTNVTFVWRIRLADNTIVTPDLEALRKEFAKQLPRVPHMGVLEPQRGFGTGAGGQ